VKGGVFALTKNEQRVVVLIVLALLTGASVRYCSVVNSDRRLNHPPAATKATATPMTSPEEEERPEPDQ
jgi:hypothetical protein